MNVTFKQKEMLLNYLVEKPKLVRDRVNRKSESRRKLNTIWDEMAAHLNTIEGPNKSRKEWAKTWQDIKGYILKKEAKRRNYMQETRGGTPPKIASSTFEENVLQLLTPEAAGLENIPEGGIINEIHNINCDTEQINNTEVNQNLTEIEEIKMRQVSKNEQNLEVNYLAKEIEEEETIENIPPKQKSISIRKAIREGSIQQLSRTMLDIQLEKLQLKKEEIRLRKKTIRVQKRILLALKNLRY